MTIANRILLGFSAIILLLIIVGIYGVAQIGVVRGATETIVARDLAMVRQISAIREDQNRMHAATDAGIKAFYRMTLNRGAPAGQDYNALYGNEATQTAAALANAISVANQYRTTGATLDRAEVWARLGTTLAQASMELDQIRQETDRQFRAIAAGDAAAVAAGEADIDVHRNNFTMLMQTCEQLIDDAVDTGQEAVRTVYDTSRISIFAGLLLTVVLGIVITYFIRRSIVVPLDAFMNFVGRVGKGDLAGQTAATGKDELGQLGATLNTMVEGLRLLARQTREATENMNAATAEIRASTQEQAAGVEEQLAAVQETAATVDEITHAGTQIAKRAQEVIASAQATAQTSTQGLRAVDETTRAMDAIRDQAQAAAENIVALSEKTQTIGDIITTVNDISERSHLLALNAAIEAAAAGESGRSFAVVASEMKLLADQAKDATAQVRAILGDIQRGINVSVMLTEESVKRVAAGKERTDTTLKTITEITARVQEGVQTFQQIVASTNQQQLGIEQVMGALQNIRQGSQQTASGIRQLDMAAGNLTGLAQQLLMLAERYRI